MREVADRGAIQITRDFPATPEVVGMLLGEIRRLRRKHREEYHRARYWEQEAKKAREGK